MGEKPEEGKARDTVTNWYAVLKGVIDGYEQKTSITHGLQKDAIQNGWDARLTKKGKDWSFTFELIEGKKNSYLCMTDQGTTGLTGQVLKADGYLDGLPSDERWAAFEGYGFTKDDVEHNRALGSRGRGKFIFVGASQSNEINYDTLTVEGNYRLGGRRIELTGSPVIHFDNEKAREQLIKTTGGIIKSLDTVGTRIIIVNPIQNLKDAIKSSEFEFMIGETWWEIIKKYDAKIIIKSRGEERVVKLPEEFDLPEKSIGKKKVYLTKRGMRKEFGGISTIIKLHLVCEPKKKIREELRGIAVQRGGMKICTIEPVALPDYIRECMYGYVTFDEIGEAEIKDAEGLEHNSISFQKSFPKELRRWLRSEMSEFAKKELAYDPHPEKEKREKQRSAERRALSAINRIANLLDFKKRGPTSRSGPSISRGPEKPIRISLKRPEFPNPESNRVDYGQSIDNINIDIINDSEDDAEVRLRIFVRYGNNQILDVADSVCQVEKHSTKNCYPPFDLKIDKTRFKQKGTYVLTARITDANMATRLDQKGFTFYVETEPMAKGIFESYKPLGMEDTEYRFSIGYIDNSSSGGIVLNYNVAHPSYQAVEDDADAATEYLFRFAAMELASMDLSSENPRIVDVNPANLTDPVTLLERYSLAMGKLFYYYHKGVT